MGFKKDFVSFHSKKYSILKHSYTIKKNCIQELKGIFNYFADTHIINTNGMKKQPEPGIKSWTIPYHNVNVARPLSHFGRCLGLQFLTKPCWGKLLY